MYVRALFPLHFGASGRAARRALSMGQALLLAACLAHCGGDGKTGSNGTGLVPGPAEDALVASGPLSALGPTGIGGTTLNDAAAVLQINARAPRPLAEIRLGMMTEAGATIAANASSATAQTLTVQSAVIGPVTSVDAVSRRLTVLSLSVQLDQNTILEGFTSLASLAAGARVEVYGLPQPQANTITATRIIALPPDSTAPVEILGSATGLTGTQFNLQGVVVATSNAVLIISGVQPSPAPPVTSIGENARVRVIGNYSVGSNTLSATQVIGGLNPVRNDNSLLVLDGLVQSVGAAGRFRVNDTDVDALTAGAGTLVPGSHVQVRGRKLAGILVASEFRLIGANAPIEFIVQGDITDFISQSSFKVRGEAINAGTAQFVGSPALLANGRQVRVRAVAGPGMMTATEVTLL